MSDDIFGCGQNRHIDALVERGVEKRRGPCIVEQRDNAVRFGGRTNGWNILHFEGQAARIFEQDRLGPVTKVRGDVCGHRIEIAGFDPEAF